MSSNHTRFVPTYLEARGSVIREMARWAADPSFISFAGGYPVPDAFDFEGLRRAADLAWATSAKDCLQYGATEGIRPLRDALTALSEQRGIAVAPEQLLVTTGSQQGLDFLLRSAVAPGDVVMVERPTYPGALQAFRLAGAHLIGVDGDADGMDVEAAARAIASAPAKPRMIYLVPTFANPSGATMGVERRKALLSLAARENILLVEDDPYGSLRFSGEVIPPIIAYAKTVSGAADVAVYLSTLSKIAVPSLRIGWMVAPADVTRRCVMAKQVSDMCTSPWNQHIAAAYLRSTDFRDHLPRIVRTYGERAQTLAAAMTSAFGSEWRFGKPDGGMFLWIKLPADVNADDLLQEALREKVLFVPGSACFGENPVSACLRLSYSCSSVAEIHEGVGRLQRAYSAYASNKRGSAEQGLERA